MKVKIWENGNGNQKCLQIALTDFSVQERFTRCSSSNWTSFASVSKAKVRLRVEDSNLVLDHVMIRAAVKEHGSGTHAHTHGPLVARKHGPLESRN